LWRAATARYTAAVDLIPIIGAVMMVILIAGWLMMLGATRREVQRVRDAWTALAGARGWSLTWPRTPVWMAGQYSRDSPLLQGTLDGTPLLLQLTGTGLNSTSLKVPIRVPDDAPPGATVPADALAPGARKLWEQLSSQRRKLVLVVWPNSEGDPPTRVPGHSLFIGWYGRERDPAVLELAFALALDLARQPPSRLGPGTPFVPHHLRA